MDWLQSFRESGAAESASDDGRPSSRPAVQPPARPSGSNRASSTGWAGSQHSDGGENGGDASSRSDEAILDVLAGFRRMKQEYGPGLPNRARREAWDDEADGQRNAAVVAHSVSRAMRSPDFPERPTSGAEQPRHISTSYRDRFNYASTEGSTAGGSAFDEDPPKELYWSELSRKLQEDAQLLGWTEQTWDSGDVSPFATPWDDLTVRQKRAAGHLGFSVSDWDDGNGSALDRSNVSESWLEQSVSATDPAATQKVKNAYSPQTRTTERARSHTTGSPKAIPTRPVVHPLVAVFEELDTDGTGLIGRLAMLERLRSDHELRARMQLSINNLDDERAAFDRVFHSMDTDPHYEVDHLTLDEFLAYIRAHRHRAEDFTLAKKPAASAAESSTQYAESELEAVGQSTILDPKSGLDQSQRASRLAFAAVPAKTKVVVYVRLPSTSAVASSVAGARRQQRRGFVLIESEAGTLADVRQEIERQKMPVPRPFAFVLDLAHGNEQVIDVADEMQVLATELEPAGRAVVIHHKFSHCWYSAEPEPEPQPVSRTAAKLKAAAAVVAIEEEEAQAAEAKAAIEEREAEAAKAAAKKQLNDVRLAKTVLAEKQTGGDVEAIKLAEEALQRAMEAAEEATLAADHEQAEADEARVVAERERAKAEKATKFVVDAESEVARHTHLDASAVAGAMNSFDDFMATAMERIQMQKEEDARLKAESLRMESIRREALNRGRHISAAKIQSAYRTLLRRRERHRQRRERVITILSLMRGYVYRRRFMRARQASITIQALGRGICARVQLSQQHQAATRLQAAHRGHSARLSRRAGTVGVPQHRSDWYQKGSPTRHGNSGRMHEIYSPDLRHNDRFSDHHGGATTRATGDDWFAHHRSGHMPAPATRDLRLELQSARLSELQQRAIAAQIEPKKVEDALDADNPKAAMIDLLLDWQEATAIVASAVHRKAVLDSRRSSTGHTVPLTAAQLVVESYERSSSPVLNSFRAEQASRQQRSTKPWRHRHDNRRRTRRESPHRRSFRHSSSDWRDQDDCESLSSDDGSTISMLSSDLSDALECEPRVRSRRSAGRPRSVAGRGRTQYLRSGDRRQLARDGDSMLQRNRGGNTDHRRPRPAPRRQDTGQASRESRGEAAAAEAIQATYRGFLLRSRLKHRVSLQLKRQIQDMEDLRATMIDEIETMQHLGNESDRLLLTQVESQLERKKAELALQLSDPRAARAQIGQSKTSRAASPGPSARNNHGSGARKSASAVAPVSNYRDRRAIPSTPQARVEAAREKQRRLAAAAQRTAGASPQRRQQQPQRSPRRAQSRAAKRLGNSDEAWPKHPTSQMIVDKPHSFLKRGGGRSSGGGAVNSPTRVSGSTGTERRRNEQMQRAVSPARGGRSPDLRVQEVVEDAGGITDQKRRQQQHLKQRAEIRAATHRAQERLDYMQAELQALAGRDGLQRWQRQQQQQQVDATRGGTSREPQPHSATMLPPGIRPLQRPPAPGMRQHTGGSPEADIGSPGDRTLPSTTVSQLEAKNVQVERRMAQYANSRGIRLGERARGT